MLEACKFAAKKLRKQIPAIASLTVFLLIVGAARGANWKASLGRLIPLAAAVIVYFIYQTIKARRMILGRSLLTKAQLFLRFYLAIGFLIVFYFGFSIFWQLRGHGDEAFSILIPIVLICGVICGVVLYRELGDLPEDFEN